MKTRYASFILPLLTLFFLTIPIQAQKMTVESMVHNPMDQTANLSENMYKDNNGEYGGLVKVMLAAPGATFEGWVLKQQNYSASEYWVFMAKKSSRLKVTVPGYLPLEVNFRNYEDCIIQSKHTYVLTITLPQLGGNVPVDDGMRYLAINVEPKNSMVFVDDKPQTLDDNGEVTVYLPMGNHSYRVIANGYAEKEGTVNLTDNTPPLEIKLKSTQATLRVECETHGAQVYINGQQRGNVPWNGQLPEGNYRVEARLDGYRTGQQTVSLVQGDSRIVTIPALQMISGRLNVDYRPIGSDVYVDGNKIGTSPNVFRDIMIGNRSVEIRKQGYETFRKTVAVKENEQTSLTGTLTARFTEKKTNDNINNGQSLTGAEQHVKDLGNTEKALENNIRSLNNNPDAKPSDFSKLALSYVEKVKDSKDKKDKEAYWQKVVYVFDNLVKKYPHTAIYAKFQKGHQAFVCENDDVALSYLLPLISELESKSDISDDEKKNYLICALREVGYIYWGGKNDLDSAIPYYKKLYELKPDDSTARKALGL